MMDNTGFAIMDKKTLKTSGLNDAQITILTQETPAHLVKQRKGRGGNYFHFLPHEEVTRILNAAFGHNWNTEVKQFGIIENTESWVLLRLTVCTEKGEIWKEQFGQQDFLTDSNGQVVMPVGDCLKGAASDALTKCASLLGVGLDLYGITAREKRESLGGSNGNGNHAKADVKRLIDNVQGMTMQGGEDAFRYFIKALNQAKTAQELETLRQYVGSFLSNNKAA